MRSRTVGSKLELTTTSELHHDHLSCPRCCLLPRVAPLRSRDEQIAQLQDQLAARDTEVTGLHGQVAELMDRIARLERAVSRNSAQFQHAAQR